MSAQAIYGSRDILAELREFAKSHPELAQKITLIQVIQAAEELKGNLVLQRMIAQEGKQTTLMQAISLLVVRQGMEKAK